MKTITTADNKLTISNGTFIYTKTYRDYIIAKITYILQTVLGEDLQNSSKGLNLEGIIFNEQITTSDIYSEVRRNLLLVPEVKDVPSIEITQKQESLQIACKVVINNQLEDITVNV